MGFLLDGTKQELDNKITDLSSNLEEHKENMDKALKDTLEKLEVNN